MGRVNKKLCVILSCYIYIYIYIYIYDQFCTDFSKMHTFLEVICSSFFQCPNYMKTRKCCSRHNAQLCITNHVHLNMTLVSRNEISSSIVFVVVLGRIIRSINKILVYN